MVTLVNYGLGNIQAFANIYKRLNIPVAVARTGEELAGAERIILPGVGHFDWAMQRLQESGMRPILDKLVLKQGRPVLGVCVGMQMMALRSDEGKLPGLGWFDAEVKRFDETKLTGRTRLPHMGWNDVTPSRPDLFKDMVAPRFYFLHSYYFAPSAPQDAMAVTSYHGNFVSAAGRGKIFGVQFHPEKSHQWGVQLLKNFASI